MDFVGGLLQPTTVCKWVMYLREREGRESKKHAQQGSSPLKTGDENQSFT